MVGRGHLCPKGFGIAGLEQELRRLIDAESGDLLIDPLEHRYLLVVEVFGNIDHTTIANASLSAEWKPVKGLRWSAKGTYSIGRDDEGDPLPLIAPLTYLSRLAYTTGNLGILAEVKGHTRQTKYGKKYGETETSAWAILNLSANYQCSMVNSQWSIRFGVENLFDKYYATYSDWCNIPQKGRNIYVNFSFVL